MNLTRKYMFLNMEIVIIVSFVKHTGLWNILHDVPGYDELYGFDDYSAEEVMQKIKDVELMCEKHIESKVSTIHLSEDMISLLKRGYVCDKLT